MENDGILLTDRLFVRKLKDGDQDLVFQITQESSLFSTLPQNEEYTDIYRKSSWEEVNISNIFNAMMFLRDTGEFVGKICMQFIDKPLPELGIDILKKHRNHGYGPEVITAFSEWYAKKFGLTEYKVRISKENSHSIHVFEQLGAEFIGTSSFVSEAALDVIKNMLPDANLSELSQDSVREYLMKLPMTDRR